MNLPAPRALVVDDDHSWQQIIYEIMEDCGLVVDVASNLTEAVASLKNQPHRLVVVDLSLSPNDHNNYDGLQVLEAARRLDPNCKSILLTGFATVELAVTALTQYGTFTFLRKESFQRNQFREIVYRALAAPQQTPSTKQDEIIPAASKIPDFSPHSSDNPAGKALVVEDDAGWRSILTELLTDAGFQVRGCASFGEALGNLRREKFTLAVVDLSLNGDGDVFWKENTPNQNLGGYQLLARIRAENVPTIVVSGVSTPGEIEQTYAEQSLFAYIEKQTFERTTFKRIVEEVRATFQPNNELNLLTEREREVFSLLAQGLTNKEISEKLTITTNTVKRHIKAIFEKMNVHTRSAIAAKVFSEKP
jgi:DNA-binding NarL/FixJ family response regulator